ncbi:hypothetical protein F4692_003706 [Nocardioides cavernae]|uniref:Uncharacterized protein n=1 Tax=Nocardioides cavernae TaxID=1921566 RepID=A0A7Y9H603_9ACTN|nr:MXAN_6640 family putative metalloprotease [Nocardioides cavernae]NYE38556.1 hypothetical protein [Nocardioides cavernae]
MRLMRTTATTLATLLTVSLGTALVAPTAGAADTPSATGDGATAQERAEAKEALAVAESAVAGTSVAGDAGRQAPDVTMAMRDLFVAKHALRGADRASAERLLARPTTPPDDPDDPRDIYYGPDADLQSQCAATYCLHWVEEGEHAATPAFAAEAFDTIGDVARVYAEAGYRAPLPDAGQEGDIRTDFYLGDIDTYGALGFCRSDADGPVDGSAWYAYCGFDNDYASSPWLDPTSLLRVTVAHEYFHAIQYAYDAEDDGWIYESTAMAMEDELYDDVNDNVFYLNYGQMGDPEAFGYPAGPSVPLDVSDLNAYGNWGFWRYLMEQHPRTAGGLPTIMRDVWEALDTTRGAAPTTSLQALDRVLQARRTSTPDEYAGFADANQHPADAYEEGAEQAYPTAPNTLASLQLAKKKRIGTHRARLDHLTSATGEVLPFPGSKFLTVAVDLDDATAQRAVVTVHRVDGTTSTTPLRVNRKGKGVTIVPFAPARVASVEVTLTNGSTRGQDALAADVGYLAVG